MTEIYSGRFDMICNYEEGGEVDKTESLRKFKEFLEYSQCKQYVVTFEDTEKDGLTKTKPHYHFLIYSVRKHDTLRKELSKLGWKGALASLSIAHAPPKRTLEKAYHYVLKHGYIVHECGISNLDELIKKAEAYNKNIVLTPSFRDHYYNFIIPQFKECGYTDRNHMLVHIIKYVANYNKNDKGHRMDLPLYGKLLPLIQNYEMEMDPENSYVRILNDYKNIAGVVKYNKVSELPTLPTSVTTTDYDSDSSVDENGYDIIV